MECKYPGSPFQEVGAAEMKNLYFQCTVLRAAEQEQEAGQSWQIGAEDVPQLHQPAGIQCLDIDNLVPIRASTRMS